MDDLPRRSPLLAQLVLLGLFVLLIVAGVFTVLLPEIRDDSNEEEGRQAPPGAPADGS